MSQVRLGDISGYLLVIEKHDLCFGPAIPIHLSELVHMSQLPKADLLTFWFSHVGFPFLVEVPKGDYLLCPTPLGQ